MNLSFGWECGRLICPALHLVRTIYIPGLAGSPARIAWLLPLGLVVHWILSGGVILMAEGLSDLTSAAVTEPSHRKVAATRANVAPRRRWDGNIGFSFVEKTVLIQP